MSHPYDPARTRLSARQAVWLGQLSVGTPPTVVPYNTLQSLKDLGLASPDGTISERGRAWLSTNSRRPVQSVLRGAPNLTYHALLDAVSDALESNDWYQVNALDITTRAMVSQATFHYYFNSVPDAARALLERKAERGQPLTEYERRLKLLFAWEDIRRADPDAAERPTREG